MKGTIIRFNRGSIGYSQFKVFKSIIESMEYMDSYILRLTAKRCVGDRVILIDEENKVIYDKVIQDKGEINIIK